MLHTPRNLLKKLFNDYLLHIDKLIAAIFYIYSLYIITNLGNWVNIAVRAIISGGVWLLIFFGK
jgi:hypothetical protein